MAIGRDSISRKCRNDSAPGRPPGWTSWRPDAIPNAETAANYRARIEPCVQEMLQRHPGQRVAVFCHGGVIRQMLALLLDLPLPKTAGFEIDYTSITEVEVHPHRAEIQLLNLTPWRDIPVAALGIKRFDFPAGSGSSLVPVTPAYRSLDHWL